MAKKNSDVKREAAGGQINNGGGDHFYKNLYFWNDESAKMPFYNTDELYELKRPQV
jgi:hypothetical protein